jgi:hypothetical protein
MHPAEGAFELVQGVDHAFERAVGGHIRWAAVATKQHDEHQGNESEQGDPDCSAARHSPLWPIGSVVLEVHQRFSLCRS